MDYYYASTKCQYLLIVLELELYKSEKVTVAANSVGSVMFLITPTKLGLVDLKVKAVSRVAGDAVTRPLRVNPPGQTQKLNKATLLDLRSGNSHQVNMTAHFPNKRVADSDFIKVTVISDILGPTVNNLDKLLGMSFNFSSSLFSEPSNPFALIGK